MKKYIITLVGISTLLISQKSKAQVAIGKDNITNSSVLLEFGPGNKGIILSATEAAPGAVGGTFIFNTIKKAVEVWEGKNNGNLGDWTLLTDENQGVTHSFSNAGTDTIPNPAGVIIGADNTTKPGVLVLESTTKALVLPQVANPNQNIKGAIAGTMVYDTTADMLAIYDGANWSYWK